MKEKVLFTANLIQLMRNSLAGPILSRDQRHRLFARIQMGMRNRKNEVSARRRLPEHAQLYLWPVEDSIDLTVDAVPELNFSIIEESMEWSPDIGSESASQQLPDLERWLFPYQNRPPVDIDFPLLRGQELQRDARSSEDTSEQLVLV